MHLRALENLSTTYPLLTAIDRMSLVKSTWHRLKAFAGAHEGDLAVAQAAGMHTAYVNVPEEDNMTQGFHQPGEVHFDVEAKDFESLCEKLQV